MFVVEWQLSKTRHSKHDIYMTTIQDLSPWQHPQTWPRFSRISHWNEAHGAFLKTWQSTVAVWQANRNQLPRNLPRRFATTYSWHADPWAANWCNAWQLKNTNQNQAMTHPYLSHLAADTRSPKTINLMQWTFKKQDRANPNPSPLEVKITQYGLIFSRYALPMNRWSHSPSSSSSWCQIHWQS